ncbi:putative ABC transporter protein [Geranomyces variabilis]|nr:putative ABC transporter protein [Geranomyces variabilis]KAJ3138126.1 (ABC) transporter [Geranomyces variabilis]
MTTIRSCTGLPPRGYRIRRQSSWAQVSLFVNADAKVVRRLRSMVFRDLVKQEIGFFDSKSNTAGILSRQLASIEAVPKVVTKVWSTCFQLFVCALMGLTKAANQYRPITLMVLLYSPVVIGASVWQTWSFSRFAERSKVAIEQSTQVAAEAVREVKTLQTLQREDFSVNRFEAFLAEPSRFNRQNAFRDSLAHGLQSTSAMWTLAISLGYGQKLIDDGSFVIEHVKFFSLERYVNAYTAQIRQVISAAICLLATMTAIASTAGAAKSYSKGLYAARMAFALLDRQSAIDPDYPGYVPASFDPWFRFTNLWFQCPTANAPTFRGEFNLEGWAGQSLAIVGPSGSGKSTVIGLLQRWYDANGGEALVGGIAIRDYALSKGLRANIALVGQEPVLFDMSIADNIAWGSELPATMEQIVEAAKQADVHDFVTALPDGYNTRVGDKGGHLSGGQKQRVAIAPALIRQPRMLLLDEATSALDSTSEVEVQHAIDRAARGRTTITIAHRLSTIKNVDRIVVINDGRVVETGKHMELLQFNGIYADMCRQQNL